MIDIFVNCVYVYEDKMVVFLNYKDGEKCIRFDDIEKDIKKANTQEIECSSLIKSGDPYGNWTHDYAVKGRRLNLLTNGPKAENISSAVVVAATGFEPVTPWVWTKCSSQLSYAAVQR